MLLCGIVFAQQDGEVWQSWYHMHYLSLYSLPSIRTFNKLNGKTPAGQSSDSKVEQINGVGSEGIDKFNGRRNVLRHPEEARILRNYNCNFSKEVDI